MKLLKCERDVCGKPNIIGGVGVLGPFVIEKPITSVSLGVRGPNVIEKLITSGECEGVWTKSNRKTDHIGQCEGARTNCIRKTDYIGQAWGNEPDTCGELYSHSKSSKLPQPATSWHGRQLFEPYL